MIEFLKTLSLRDHTLWLVLGTLFLLLAVAVPWFASSSSGSIVDITLRLTAAEPARGQIFYDTGNGYSEAQSRLFSMVPGTHDYRVRLDNIDVTSIGRIRIDPGDGPGGVVRLDSIRLGTPAGAHRLDADDLATALVALHAVQIARVPAGMQVEVLGTDPYFDFESPALTPGESLSWSPFVFGCMFWSLVAGLVLLYRQTETNVAGGLWAAGVTGAIAVLVLAISPLVPPFQSPDEFKHVERAYLVSNGQLMLTTHEAGTGGMLDPALPAYFSSFAQLPFHADRKLSAASAANARSIPWSTDRQFVNHPETAPYHFAIYLPQAMALRVAQDLSWTIDDSYKFARLVTLATTLFILAAALLLVRPGLLQILLLSLPMTIFQFSSVTIDAVSVALAMLAFSIYCRFESNYRALTLPVYLVLLGVIAVVVTSRPYMLPMLLLPAIVALQSRRPAYWIGAFALLAACLGWILFGTTQVVDTRIDVGSSRADIVVFYLTNPLQFFSLLARTFETQGGFYAHSFLGVLGWLDAPLPGVFYQAASWILALGVALSVSFATLRQHIVARSGLILVALVSSLLVFIALLINWSSHPAELVVGVQGRYFLIPALALAFAICKPWRAEVHLPSIALLLAWFALVGHVMAATLIDRYYL